MASVRSNSNGNCLIELGRNHKKVRVITRLETVYDVREFRLEEKELVGKGVDKITLTRYFDKEFTPVTTPEGAEYPVKKCALKYLANQYTPCTDRARRELMILVLNSELKLIGKFADDQMATALETGPEGGHVIMTPEEIAAEFEVEDIAVLYAGVGGYEPEKTKSKLEKNPSHIMKLSVAKQIYELAKNYNLNPIIVKKQRAASEKSSTKKSLQEKHPVTTALIAALKNGGTKERIVSTSMSELAPNEKITEKMVSQQLSLLTPILQIAGVLALDSDNYKWL